MRQAAARSTSPSGAATFTEEIIGVPTETGRPPDQKPAGRVPGFLVAASMRSEIRTPRMDNLRTLTALIDTPAQRAESAIWPVAERCTALLR